MGGFVEGFWIFFVQCRMQMCKVDVWIKLFDYINQIVVSVYVVRFGIYGEVVCYVINGFYYLLYVFNGRDNVWQVENRVWWIVRVNGYMYVNFVGNWNNGFQEIGKMFMQFCFIDIFICCQVLMELIQCIVFFCVR